jgi:hypothetical protein
MAIVVPLVHVQKRKIVCQDIFVKKGSVFARRNVCLYFRQRNVMMVKDVAQERGVIMGYVDESIILLRNVNQTKIVRVEVVKKGFV